MDEDFAEDFAGVPGDTCQQDLWSALPDEIKVMILRYLTRRDLGMCNQVSRDWRRVCSDLVFASEFVRPEVEVCERCDSSDDEEYLFQYQRWLEDCNSDDVPRLSLLSAPRRPGQSYITQHNTIRNSRRHVNTSDPWKDPVEFGQQPHDQILGIQAVADVIVTLSGDGRLRSYHVETLELVRESTHAHCGPPTILVRETIGQVELRRVDRLCLSLDPASIHVWSIPSLDLCCVLPHQGAVSACVTADQRFLASWDDKTGIAWDLAAAMRARLGVDMLRKSFLPTYRQRSRLQRASKGSNSCRSSRIGRQRGINGAGAGSVDQQRRQRQQRRRRRSSSSTGQEIRLRSKPASAASAAPALVSARQRDPYQLVCYHVDHDAVLLENRTKLAQDNAKLRLPDGYKLGIYECGFLKLQEGDSFVLAARHCVLVWHVRSGLGVPPGGSATRSHTIHLPDAPLIDTLFLATNRLAVIGGSERWSDHGMLFGLRYRRAVIDFAPSNRRQSGEPRVVVAGSDDAAFASTDRIWSVYDGNAYWRAGGWYIINTAIPTTSPMAFDTAPLEDYTSQIASRDVVWWRNQRVHMLSSTMFAALASDRSVRVIHESEQAEPIHHFRYGEYPHDLAEGDESIVVMTVSLPYLFTAGGPAHSIKRWDLTHPPRARSVSHRITKAVSAAARYNLYRKSARINAFLILSAWVLWQLRLDRVIMMPYTLVLAPVWLLYLIGLDYVWLRDRRRWNLDIVRKVQLRLQVLLAFASLLLFPLGAAMRVDNFVAWPWWLISLPVFAFFCFFLIIAGQVLVFDRSNDSDLLLAPIIGLYSLGSAMFTLARSIIADLPDETAKISAAHSFWFLWAGLITAALYTISTAVVCNLEAMVRLAAWLLRRPSPHWAGGVTSRLPRPFCQPWGSEDYAATLSFWAFALLVFGTQYMWYCIWHTSRDYSFAVSLIPVDIIVSLLIGKTCLDG